MRTFLREICLECEDGKQVRESNGSVDPARVLHCIVSLHFLYAYCHHTADCLSTPCRVAISLAGCL